MRLMLGTQTAPSLLVTVQQERTATDFDFRVVNGLWEGTYTDGHITVWGCPGGDFSSLDNVEILTDNQDRLRGEYDDVFYNFDNPDYIAPVTVNVVTPSSWDDDIPF